MSDAPGADEPQRPTSATVLVVDDEPSLLDLMGRVLERAGYRVLVAADGPSALEQLASSDSPVDAVLIDLRIRPEGATAILDRMLELAPGLGVVLTSGSPPDAAIRERLRSQGGQFVRKPFAPEQLLEALASVLAR